MLVLILLYSIPVFKQFNKYGCVCKYSDRTSTTSSERLRLQFCTCLLGRIGGFIWKPICKVLHWDMGKSSWDGKPYVKIRFTLITCLLAHWKIKIKDLILSYFPVVVQPQSNTKAREQIFSNSPPQDEAHISCISAGKLSRSSS